MSEKPAVYETDNDPEKLVIRAVREVIWQTGCGSVLVEIQDGKIVKIVKTTVRLSKLLKLLMRS